jgi:hypothetical protein
MLALLLKLSLAPALVAAATLVARRAGARVAGLISGLPVVAGPIALVFAVQEGHRFAAAAAAGAVLGIASLVAFCVVYAYAARRAPVVAALLAADAAFALATAGFYFVHPPLLASIAITAGTILAGGLVLRRRPRPQRRPAVVPGGARAPGASDLLLWRVAITIVLVVALTAVAHGLSAHLAGLLTPAPIITAVMAGFTHNHAGGSAAAALLSGLVLALLSFLAFFAVLAAVMRDSGSGVAFACATAAALTTWGALVALSQRRSTRSRPAGPAAQTAGSRRGGSTAAPSAYRSAP